MAALPTDDFASPTAHSVGAPVRRSPARESESGQPNLRIVDQPRRTGRWLVLLLLLAVAALVGIVSLSALSAEASYTASELESEITELSYRYDELTAEVATLESPERIRQVAEGELGMVPSEQPAYLVLDPAEGSATASEPESGSDTPDDSTGWEYTSHTGPQAADRGETDS